MVIQSEYTILNDSANILIISFGGMAGQFYGTPPFEFLNFLSAEYKKKIDLYFYIDVNQCWYHKGIEGISKDINTTVLYLKNKINKKKYKNVIFIGTSSGGYASILLGSLCSVNNVLAFIPITTYKNKMIESTYFDLKNIINNKTCYHLYGDNNITNKKNSHHYSECENINKFKNVKVIYKKNLSKGGLKILRDNGILKKIIDNIINNL